MENLQLQEDYRTFYWKVRKESVKRNLYYRFAGIFRSRLERTTAKILSNLICHEKYLRNKGIIVAGERFHHTYISIAKQEKVSFYQIRKAIKVLLKEKMIYVKRGGEEDYRGNKNFYSINFIQIGIVMASNPFILENFPQKIFFKQTLNKDKTKVKQRLNFSSESYSTKGSYEANNNNKINKFSYYNSFINFVNKENYNVEEKAFQKDEKLFTNNPISFFLRKITNKTSLDKFPNINIEIKNFLKDFFENRINIPIQNENSSKENNKHPKENKSKSPRKRRRVPTEKEIESKVPVSAPRPPRQPAAERRKDAKANFNRNLAQKKIEKEEQKKKFESSKTKSEPELSKFVAKWNSLPGTPKHRSASTKTHKQITTYIRQLKKGTFMKENLLDEKYLIKNKVPVRKIRDKKWTDDEIMKGIEKIGDMYLNGNTPMEKGWFPKSLALWLCNSHYGSTVRPKSFFLAAYYSDTLGIPVSEVNEAKDPNPELTEIFMPLFDGRELSKKEKAQLVRGIEELMDFRRIHIERCDVYIRHTIQRAFRGSSKIGFCEYFVEYIEEELGWARDIYVNIIGKGKFFRKYVAFRAEYVNYRLEERRDGTSWSWNPVLLECSFPKHIMVWGREGYEEKSERKEYEKKADKLKNRTAAEWREIDKKVVAERQKKEEEEEEIYQKELEEDQDYQRARAEEAWGCV